MEQPQIPVVLALIKNDNNELLLQVRIDPNLPAKHNKWEFAGGKVEYQETPEEAVVREVKEETGLDVEIVSLFPKIFSKHWIKNDGSEYKVILIPYVCRVVGGLLQKKDDEPKISEIRFVPAGDIAILEWGSEIDKQIAIEFSKF